MRRKIKYLMPVMLACSMMQFSCSDWTDPESINIHTPSMEEQNPELYAQYLESLNNFKATDHQVVIVSVNNVSTVTTSRSQHLTDMPDSLDYICLNNTMEVNQANISEMKEVRRLGTKVLGLVDFLKKKQPTLYLIPNLMKQKMEKKEKRLSTMQHVLLNTAKVRSLNKSPQVTL